MKSGDNGMKVESTEVAKIHHALQDDVSRFLFEKRLLYSLTGDEAYIRDIALSFEELQPIRTLAEERTDNFIFGAGTYGDITVHLALGHFLGIFDNDAAKWGGRPRGGRQLYLRRKSASIQRAVCFSPCEKWGSIIRMRFCSSCNPLA